MQHKAKLREVFGHAGEKGWRYIPRATGLPNGHWLVFDNTTDRFLELGAVGKIDPSERIAMEKISGG